MLHQGFVTFLIVIKFILVNGSRLGLEDAHTATMEPVRALLTTDVKPKKHGTNIIKRSRDNLTG
jgi:hypothetical protein